MDAAGPLYDEQLGSNNRLNSKMADHVDCIHTSTAFGMKKSCGSIDFYPNGGADQPSCTSAAISGKITTGKVVSDSELPQKDCQKKGVL